MVERDRIGEQQAARVVPIVLALDHLGAVLRDEFPEVQLQALPDRSQVRPVGLLDVLGKTQTAGIAAVDHVHGVSESEGKVISDAAVVGVGGFVEDQLDHVQTELLRRTVKSAERRTRRVQGAARNIVVRTWHGARMLEVVAVVAVHKARDAQRTEQGRQAGRGRSRGRLSAGRGLSGRSRWRRGRGGGSPGAGGRRRRDRRRSRGFAQLLLHRSQLALEAFNLLLEIIDTPRQVRRSRARAGLILRLRPHRGSRAAYQTNAQQNHPHSSGDAYRLRRPFSPRSRNHIGICHI